MTREELKEKNPMFRNSIDSASDEEIKLATDPDYIRNNTDKFLTSRWNSHGGNSFVDLAHSVRGAMSPYMNSTSNYLAKHRNNAIQGPWTNSLLYGGGLGALGGLGLSLLRGGDSPVRDALIGSALVGGLTLAANRSFNGIRNPIESNPQMYKQSSVSDLVYIQQKIMSEPGYSHTQKQEMIRRVSSLPESQISQLSRMLKTAFGVGVGAILSQFLGAGSLATLGGSLLGGILGFTSHAPFAVDAFGRKKLLNN